MAVEDVTITSKNENAGGSCACGCPAFDVRYLESGPEAWTPRLIRR